MLIYKNLIQLFNDTCFYTNIKNKNGMIIYGQYNELSNDVRYWDSVCNVESAKGNIKEFNSYINFIDYEIGKGGIDRNDDFYIFIEGELKKFVGKRFNITINNIKLNSIKMYFPFLNINLNKNNSESNIIFTMVKDYNHRLDEWIKYNLKLGFDSIVLFDNSKNTNNQNEQESYKQNIHKITDKYKNVHVIEYNYKPFYGKKWPTIQRIAFQIFVNAFKYTCRYIALFDADEFIYIPNSNNNIKDFLINYNEHLIIKSKILTNKNKNDKINNNILELCRYDSGDKYTKSFIYCQSFYNNIGNIRHHNISNGVLLEKNIIIHYHCWVNKRSAYKETMEKIDQLYLFYNK